MHTEVSLCKENISDQPPCYRNDQLCPLPYRQFPTLSNLAWTTPPTPTYSPDLRQLTVSFC